MINLSITLNEPIEEILILQQEDAPILKLTAYDYDGTALDPGYTGTFIVGRSGVDPNEWTLVTVDPTVASDNIFYFNLEEITYTRGEYQGYLYVENPTETTPEVTPESVGYSYLPIRIEVK